MSEVVCSHVAHARHLRLAPGTRPIGKAPHRGRAPNVEAVNVWRSHDDAFNTLGAQEGTCASQTTTRPEFIYGVPFCAPVFIALLALCHCWKPWISYPCIEA